MGAIVEPKPVKLFVGMLAGRPEWLDAARETLVRRFGPADLESPRVPFGWTNYYAREMGEGLLRQFLAFERLIAPDEIVEIKRATNAMEDELARGHGGVCKANGDSPPNGNRGTVPIRPVNLDPGCLSLSKVVLATTKDYSHRLYLGRGIYAEVTLHFHKGRYEPWEWTYRDYRTEEYQAFFLDARRTLHDQLTRETP